MTTAIALMNKAVATKPLKVTSGPILEDLHGLGDAGECSSMRWG